MAMPYGGTGRMGLRLARPGLALCCSTFSAPHAPQAVQTLARRPRRTPKEQLWERMVVRSMRLEEVALVCFPAAPGASFPLRVCFAFQQLPAVEGWPPSGPRSWSPRHFQTPRSGLVTIAQSLASAPRINSWTARPGN